jgi:hypothetical protein
MNPLLKLTKIKNLIASPDLLVEKHNGMGCKPDDMAQSEAIEFTPSKIGGIYS